jgi:hypothetical protein
LLLWNNDHIGREYPEQLKCVSPKPDSQCEEDLLSEMEEELFFHCLAKLKKWSLSEMVPVLNRTAPC